MLDRAWAACPVCAGVKPTPPEAKWGANDERGVFPSEWIGHKEWCELANVLQETEDA